MRTDNRIRFVTIVIALVFAAGLSYSQASAQAPSPSPPQPRKSSPPRRPMPVIRIAPIIRVNPVILQKEIIAPPQVVTILHRLNGLKVFRLLLRSNEEVGAVANLDEAFKIAGDVHTNVIAGLALDDGRTIAAWLPEAEAEMPPPALTFAPKAAARPRASSRPSSNAVPPLPDPATVPDPMQVPDVPSTSFGGNLFDAADIKIVTRDGKQLLGHYVGLDGLSGLSVIRLTNTSLPRRVEAKEETVSVGQRLRLIGPEPASHAQPGRKNAMFVRIGETDAWVASVNRSPSGGVARVKIKSGKLSQANIGSIAINEAGETLGIVDAVEGSQATLVPVALVRSAAKRVMARQASVPRPWLGIRGEPIGKLSIEKIQRGGWQAERARALCEKQQGILLTGVVPGSPAARAQLKPGDVILSVNDEDIGNADEFSWLLEEANPGTAVRFGIARPGQPASEAVEIKLSESPDPWFGLRMLKKHSSPNAFEAGSLMAHGIETIAIQSKVALRLGATGGLLVVYVQPATAAFKAGVRPGDVIEAIDGENLSETGSTIKELLNNMDEGSTFRVVRHRQKLILTIPPSKNKE